MVQIKWTCVLLCLLLGSTWGKPIVGNKVIVALNCGSKDQEVDSLDKSFKYKPDESFVSGKSVDVDYHSNDDAKEADIKFTFEKRLYMYERHTYDEMTYSLPVKQGKHTIILKFAEMYFKNAGERVFNIKIGSKIVRQDFDVVRESGSKYAAHQEFIQIQVQKDGVYFQGSKVTGGLAGGKLKLSFSKGKADNPIIQAIIVYHDSIENSPRAEYRQMKEKWQTQREIQKAMKEEQALKDLLAVQKKKEKIVIRNDQLIVEKAEQTEETKPTPQKFGFLRRLAMGPIGILFWTAVIAFQLNFLYRKVFLMGAGQSAVEEKKND